MKQLTERTEMAKAMNFGKYAVVRMDLSKNQFKIGDRILGFSSETVRVPWQYHGETLYQETQLSWYEDEKKFSFTSGGSCIAAGFGYGDLIKMADGANAPIVDKGQEFILVVFNSETRKAACPMIVKAGEHKDIHCSTTLTVDEEQIDLLALYKELC